MLRRFLAIAGGAALYALALPRFDLWPCAWLALVPLILVVRGRAAGAAVGYGALAGFVSGWAATWWLAKAVAGYFQAGILIGALAMSAAYAVAVSSAFVLFALGARALAGRGGAFAIAALWTACELVRTRIFGQPWGLLGYTQHGEAALLQVAALTGVYGVSFVVALGNAAIAEAWWRWRTGTPALRTASALAAPGALVAAVWLGGTLVLPPAVAGGPERPRVAVVQSNVQPAFHWTRAHAEEQLLANLRLTDQLAGQHPALVVWPENAVTLYLEQEPYIADQLRRAAARQGFDLLVGGPRFADGHTYNSARLLHPDGRPGAAYDKQRLVAFAEAPPFEHSADAQRDESPRAFSAGTLPGVLRSFAPLAVSICHELLYPDVINPGVAAGGSILVNLANDGWLDGGYGVGGSQHFAMGVLRAVETRRYLVRASTTGVSAIVDAWGRVLASQPPDGVGIAVAGVAPRYDLTPYVRFGDVFAIGCALAVLLVLARELVPAPRRRRLVLPVPVEG